MFSESLTMKTAHKVIYGKLRDVKFCKIIKLGGKIIEDIDPDSITIHRLLGSYIYRVSFTDANNISHTCEGQEEKIVPLFNNLFKEFNWRGTYFVSGEAKLKFSRNMVRTSNGSFTVLDENGRFSPVLWEDGGLSYMQIVRGGRTLRTLIFSDVNRRNAFLAEILTNIDFDWRSNRGKIANQV